MKYNNITKGVFISRPNRFIAKVLIDGKEEICHVKNTGRCKELLKSGTEVYLEKSDSSRRKTAYDLVACKKGKDIFNIDSIMPNKVVYEWLLEVKYFGEIRVLKPEYTFGKSRFDFYLETPEDRYLIEVKGVTLEENGVMMFPDAPTERGVKHIKELIDATKKGYKACIIFVSQTMIGKVFTPNRKTHPQFAEALFEAVQNNVKALCLGCMVTKDTIKIDNFIDIII